MSGPYEENPVDDWEWLQPPGRSRADKIVHPSGDDGGDGMAWCDDDASDLSPADGRPWTRLELRSARSRAQARAKTRLSHEYRIRYRQLYAIEVEREGLSVERPQRVGNPAAKTVQRERDAGLDQRPTPGSGPKDVDD